MHGSVSGMPGSTSDQVFGICSALGSLAFAFNFASLLVEIQDTLREPPKAVTSMSKCVRPGEQLAVHGLLSPTLEWLRRITDTRACCTAASRRAIYVSITTSGTFYMAVSVVG